MTRKKFLRAEINRYSKLGKGRKKLHKWRKPKGRHNKMRENKRGHPSNVRAGYKSDKKKSGKIDGAHPKLIFNLKDLNNVKKGEAIIIGKIGARKKIEIMKKAGEMKLVFANLRGGKNNAVK